MRKPGRESWEGLQGEPSRQKEGQRLVPRGVGVGRAAAKTEVVTEELADSRRTLTFTLKEVVSHWRDLGFSKFDLYYHYYYGLPWWFRW